MGPNDYDPRDFGADGHHVTENRGGHGWDHHTVYDRDGNRFSWDEVEYTDSQGNTHREVTNTHYNGKSPYGN